MQKQQQAPGVSRGDRTPLELFLGGVRGWEAGLRRFFVGLLDGE
jgi:hypothetical protein